MKTYWLKLYTEILHDPKINALNLEQFRGYIYLLCTAKEHDKDGFLPPEKTILFLLRMTRKPWQRLLASLIDRGLIERVQTTEGEQFKVHGWEARQNATTSSAERMRRFRERHSDVTSSVTSVTQNVTCDADVTRQERREERREKRDTPPTPSLPITPADSDTRIRALADAWPTPKGREVGLTAIVGQIASSVNPEATLRGMEAIWPGWVKYHAANEERFRPRLDRFVQSLDWMHKAPAPGEAKPKANGMALAPQPKVRSADDFLADMEREAQERRRAG